MQAITTVKRIKGILLMTLSLCLGAAAAPAALAETAAPITEQEAHGIAVDAYVYFYFAARSFTATR
ncbi:hypothetical protein ACM43_18405 [Bradyrhizobium sp. CCBAU 45321]|uniref:hypothetical protein n=1 Tax=Bradyrhizobium sp. CCBAU 45321 TaxID=1641878 RepID=UPI0023037B36|nr:hypothetical protein [Bradyrhizobium sp. CCBAU 45321]MDA9546369.1 hypothetical protein [Bradyrhizobium sp. CCBAU 45321]